MPTRLSSALLVFITLVSAGMAVYFYPVLPARIASHWSMEGNVNGYMSKFWGVSIMPITLLFMTLIYFVIPRIDPHKQNFWFFRKEYNMFFVLISLFFFGIQFMTLLWNTGVHFNMIEIMLPMTGILFFYIGVLLHYTKPNWFVGIRTPWTLSNPIVWEKTHLLGGTLFKIAGILACAGMLWPSYGVWFIVVPTLSISLFLVVYSYVMYQKVMPHSPSL